MNNPFESTQTYSQKFNKPRRTMPKLDECRYGMGSSEAHGHSLMLTVILIVTKLFPPELQPLIDPEVSQSGVKSVKRTTKARLDAEERELEKEAEEEEDLIEEEQDDDFEADEVDDEDGHDDYNAEQYFDNGEDDALEDEGGGDYD
jgi:DNA-directed RNA polymerase III subunit RPC7